MRLLVNILTIIVFISLVFFVYNQVISFAEKYELLKEHTVIISALIAASLAFMSVIINNAWQSINSYYNRKEERFILATNNNKQYIQETFLATDKLIYLCEKSINSQYNFSKLAIKIYLEEAYYNMGLLDANILRSIQEKITGPDQSNQTTRDELASQLSIIKHNIYINNIPNKSCLTEIVHSLDKIKEIQNDMDTLCSKLKEKLNNFWDFHRAMNSSTKNIANAFFSKDIEEKGKLTESEFAVNVTINDLFKDLPPEIEESCDGLSSKSTHYINQVFEFYSNEIDIKLEEILREFNNNNPQDNSDFVSKVNELLDILSLKDSTKN